MSTDAHEPPARAPHGALAPAPGGASASQDAFVPASHESPASLDAVASASSGAFTPIEEGTAVPVPSVEARGRRARRLRVPIEGLAAGELALSKEAAAYVARVHRLGVGAGLVLFDPEHAVEGEAEIVSVGAGGRAVTVHVASVRPAEVRAARAVTLVQALGKGDKMDAIVRDATELGVTRIVPVIAERSVVRPEDAAGRAARWRRIAVEAARQCGRGDAPAIDAPAPLIEAVARLTREHASAGAGASASTGTYASIEADTCVSTDAGASAGAEAHAGAGERERAHAGVGAAPFGACLVPGAEQALGAALRELDPGAAVTVVVGPEGGLSDAEIDACEAAGIRCFGLGTLVLRTETVCAAVLGALLILGAGSPHAARKRTE